VAYATSLENVVPSLLNLIPVTVPAASLALKVRVTVVEVVEAAPELILTLPVGGVVSAAGIDALLSADLTDSLLEES
jgi:hypothetical protein